MPPKHHHVEQHRAGGHVAEPQHGSAGHHAVHEKAGKDTDGQNGFETVYQGDIIGGYQLNDPTRDYVVPFDGMSSGARDHLLLYRAGTGICSVLRRSGNDYSPIYQSKDGIGGWDFKYPYDRAFAFDFDHSGKADHLVCYRPGAGGVFVLKHDGQGNFTPVYAQYPGDTTAKNRAPNEGNGIGVWGFTYIWDRMIAFDMDHSRKNDALFIYRRRTGEMCAIKNVNGQFVTVTHEWCWGLGGYKGGPRSYAFAFDWTRSGCTDHILWIDTHYDTSTPTVITVQGDRWVAVWKGSGVKDSIGGFPIPEGSQDYGGKYGHEVQKTFGLVYDFEGSGANNHLGLFNAQAGILWFMAPENGKWAVKYKSHQGLGSWDVKGGIFDRCIAIDYDGSGQMDHLLAFRRQHSKIWILRKSGHQSKPPLPPSAFQQSAFTEPLGNIAPPPVPQFSAVVQTTSGLAGFDLSSPHDHCFAYDHDHKGVQDHLCFYRPGGGLFWVGRHDGQGSFIQIVASSGIGGFDLKASVDRAFAFDFNHSGLLDHICLYRPGSGSFAIVTNSNGTFTPAFHSGNQGIGGYPLNHKNDRAFAFDYDHSGKRDHIVLYAPGPGNISIVKNVNGTFSAVFETKHKKGEKTSSIGGFGLHSENDRIFAFDYDHSGKLDYMVVMRCGGRLAGILANNNGKFHAINYHTVPQPSAKKGAAKKLSPAQQNLHFPWMAPLGGFGLESTTDHAFPLDFTGNGCMDHICFYRPGVGIAFIVQNLMGSFAPVYQGFSKGLGGYGKKTLIHGYPLYKIDGKGLGGFDLMSPNDRCIPFDFNSSGYCDHIVAYRPGQKYLVVVKATNVPPTVYQRAQQQSAPVLTQVQDQQGWNSQPSGSGQWAQPQQLNPEGNLEETLSEGAGDDTSDGSDDWSEALQAAAEEDPIPQ